MVYNKSKFVELAIKDKKVKVANWYNVAAVKKYFDSYKKDRDYRKAFCILVFTMVDRNKDDLGNSIVEVNDIEMLSDDNLMEIINLYLNFHKEFNNYFKESLRDDYFEAFYLASKKYKEVLITELSKSIDGLTSKIANTIQESIKPALDQITKSFSEIFKDMPEIIERIKQFDGEFEQFKTIIVELGFPPHEELLPIDVSKIVRIHKLEGREKAEKVTYDIYINYYNNETIKTMSNKWYEFKIMEKRKHIIRQAVKAHLRGNYYTSIPIVFSQIEGLIANIFQHGGQMNGKDYTYYLSQLLNDNEDCSFDGLINKFYSRIVLVSFGHNQPVKSILSRHAIMHGGDTRYGTKINSIKSLLLFDYMVSKISDYYLKVIS